jgi:hypothetical protein
MKAYPLDTLWLSVMLDVLQIIDETYIKAFDWRVKDISQFVLFFSASKTKVPEEYRDWTLRAMWTELVKGTSIRRGQQATMVLDLYAVVEYPPPILSVSSFLRL